MKTFSYSLEEEIELLEAIYIHERELTPRVHLVRVTPKIFGVGFKILRRTGVRSARCRRTEASDKGNIWSKWRTLTNLA